MFKIIAFLNRRQQLSMAEMRSYYENHHLPLVRRTFPQIIEHRRNYIDANRSFFAPTAPGMAYDVVSEIWFEDRAGFEGMLAILNDPKASEEIRKDELNFLDTSRCGMTLVDEAISR